MSKDDRNTAGAVELKETTSVTVAAVRSEGYFGEIGQVLMDLFRWVLASGGQVAGFPMALFPELPEDPGQKEGPFLVCVPVEDGSRLRKGGDVDIVKLPPVKVVCCRHVGSLKKVPEAYRLILDWIEDNGFEVSGPAREIYMTNPLETDEDDRVTEVQIPVRRPKGRIQ
jgi:effector-binding domain-containing protein